MRTLTLLAAVFAAVVCAEALKAGRQTPEPCYEFNCSDNRPCENDAGCLGPCYCDLETSECVPN